MKSWSWIGLIWLAVVCAVGPASADQNRHAQVNLELIGPVDVVAPPGDPSAFVIYISDLDGVTAARRAEADRLVARGAAVALVEINEFLRRQAASDDVECHYAFGDLEDLAHAAQRELHAPEWLWPVIIGTGEGGTAAYLSIAQAPSNTAAGAVSIGFTPNFKSKLPFCPGAPDQGKSGDSYLYAPMTDIPGRWTLITSAAPDDSTAHFVQASRGTKSVVVPQDQLFNSAIDCVFEIAALPKPTLSSIPLVELPATNSNARAIFILLSGDGGWRDIDKQIGEFLSQHGVHVIGIDSLRYFWKKKAPQEIASDINRVVDYYTKKWNAPLVGLGGFSFGADVIPLAWKHMSSEFAKGNRAHRAARTGANGGARSHRQRLARHRHFARDRRATLSRCSAKGKNDVLLWCRRKSRYRYGLCVQGTGWRASSRTAWRSPLRWRL